jgi:Uma2 family endonuclease
VSLIADTPRTSPALHPITVEVYHQMIAAGSLPEDARLELIDGMIVRKDRSAVGEDPMTVSNGHRFATMQVAALDARARPLGAMVQSQQPIELDTLSAPEPDGAVIFGPNDRYRERLPTASDVTAVIEVADSSLRKDRLTKQSLYASCGIPQYVIINLVDRVVEVYDKPSTTAARYEQSVTLHPGETLRLRLPAEQFLDVSIDELLP